MRFSKLGGVRPGGWWRARLAALLLGCGLGHGAIAPKAAVEPPLANLAAFGSVSIVDKAHPTAKVDVTGLAQPKSAPVALVPGNALLLEWDHPRALRTLRLVFAGQAPPPESVVIEWWRRIWPDNGTGGWMKLDDPFNGQWTAVRTLPIPNSQGPALSFHFGPLETDEAPGIQHPGATHRLTYKLRVSCGPTVRLAQVLAWSDAVTRQARLKFEWNLDTKVPGTWSPTFEARNGRVLRTRGAGRNAALVEVEYADAPGRLSTDRGHVICRSGETRSFSVFVDDVLREGVLLVRDIGALVSDADKTLTSTPETEVWAEGTVMEQVAKRPEQSFAQLEQAFPLKPPPHIHLGVPDLRQEITLLPPGDIQLRADSLRSPGPDAELRPWKWPDLTFQFGTGERPVMGPGGARQVVRGLEAGWLPVVRHGWTNEDLVWTETCLATVLGADLRSLDSQTGTEPVVLVVRFECRNPTQTPREAHLWTELNHPVPSRLSVDGTWLLDRPSDTFPREGLVPVRGRFNTFGRGNLELAVLVPGGPGSFNSELKDSAAAREAVHYRVALGPGESGALELVAPYIELLDRAEMAALKSLTFSAAHEAVVSFWQTRIQRGMTYEVPDRYLNEFFKANLWHVLISTDLDPATGQAQHGAATHEYRNYLNETAMVARSLEMRGEADAARRLLEPFLASQGVKGLPGNFRSRRGVLYAAHPYEPDPYTAQGYNMHHGWGMWAAAEHYYWTRDLAFLRQHADRLIQAAEWVVAERQATQTKRQDGSRPVEFGLLPAGDLEDVEEYLYFYATDAYTYLGLKHVAAVLAKAAAAPGARKTADPAAQRWQRAAESMAKEAEAFRRDLQASVAESVASSPVVRLRDGAYVPYVPARAYALTHLKEGWIREGLYPALHLVCGEVYDPRHPFTDWMIQELEDNVFLSAESGYGVPETKTNFFHMGGFTLQPNLLDLAIIYLQRDQTPNFLRAFYNTAWASLYPDAMCFAEWVPRLGQGGGPLYKTPDECKFIQWMRQMLVLERGEALELGLGVPRAWMTDGQRVRIQRAATYFGPLDLEITSRAATGKITASVRLQPSEPPKAVRLRLRHPEGRPMSAATVNGAPGKIDAARQLVELPLATAAWQVEAEFAAP